MELFGRAVRIVDDVMLFQGGNARRVKPGAHYERPEDEHDHWREDGTQQCLSIGSLVHTEVIIPICQWPQRIANDWRPDSGTSGYRMDANWHRAAVMSAKPRTPEAKKDGLWPQTCTTTHRRASMRWRYNIAARGQSIWSAFARNAAATRLHRKRWGSPCRLRVSEALRNDQVWWCPLPGEAFIIRSMPNPPVRPARHTSAAASARKTMLRIVV
jgi:hypothetical protein